MRKYNIKRAVAFVTYITKQNPAIQEVQVSACLKYNHST
jgi:hypothetical protein